MAEINIFDPPWTPDFVLSAAVRGSGSCLRCGVLVDLELRHIETHRRFHQRIEEIIVAVSQAEELAACHSSDKINGCGMHDNGDYRA